MIQKVKPTFIDLPPEILIKIFCHTKISGNNLAQTNKQLNRLLTMKSLGSHYIRNLIQTQFVSDLNKRILSILPSVNILLEEFRSRNLESLSCYKIFIKNLEYFSSHRYALSIKVFKYKFTKAVDIQFLSQYVLMDVKNIKEERHNRSKFLKNQIKTLKHELVENTRSEQENRDVDYDALSSLAENLFNGLEYTDDAGGSPAPEEDLPDEQSTEDHEVSTIYQSQLSTPYVESIYSSIDSMDTFMRVLHLIHNFGFRFQNLNEAIAGVAESKMQFKDKMKIIVYCFDNYIKKSDNDDQKTYKVSVRVMMKLFDMLIGSHYNQKCERLVNSFLSHVYQNEVNEDNEIDSELWDYVKRSKEADLFQILCGYSTPNFAL